MFNRKWIKISNFSFICFGSLIDYINNLNIQFVFVPDSKAFCLLIKSYLVSDEQAANISANNTACSIVSPLLLYKKKSGLVQTKIIFI